MVELHGWALIRESFSTDSEEDNIERIADSLSHEISKLRMDDRQLRMDYCNGEAVVTATKLANHFSDDIKGILRFFQQIARVAPGSYGVLYLYNDEDTDGFCSLRMMRNMHCICRRPSGLQWMKRFFLQVLICFSHPIESGRMINLILRPLNGTYREITDMLKE